MKILTLSDEPCRALWQEDARKRLEGIDLILSCGDLPEASLEFLTNFTTAPIVYVHGNHDKGDPEGCISAEDRLIVWRGVRILGLGGCIRYDPKATYQYTEREMARRVARVRRAVEKAGGIDILLTHSPARGLNDGSDPAHKGFECFHQLLEEYKPKYFVHGHVHISYNPAQPRLQKRGDIMLVNACERYLLEAHDLQPSGLPGDPKPVRHGLLRSLPWLG